MLDFFTPYLRRFAVPLAAGLASALLLTACAGRPEAPILESANSTWAVQTASRLAALLPADVLLVGEQHDAPDHHQIEQHIVSSLAARGLLAAVALEMADTGTSTAQLKPSATDTAARQALQWNDKAWPWADYGPAVMTAVRAGVPVLGANLPAGQMLQKMQDASLDGQLPGPALKAQQQGIRIGHCNLLPESQITPMTRIQIARDRAMAATLQQVLLPGKTVVLLAGNAHVDRTLGVPQHLPAGVKAASLHLRAGNGLEGSSTTDANSVWATPALPETDYCAGLADQLASPKK